MPDGINKEVTMINHDYTKEEISVNDYLINELKVKNNLAEHLKAIMDSGAFINPQYAIDSIMDQNDRNSLMCYLVRAEKYEEAAWLLHTYDDMFIKASKHSKGKVL